MSDFTITIVGTGVIGTSIGLALKQHNDPPRLVAHDKELANAKAAVKMGAFDKAEWNLINACEQANLIVLATPPDGIRPTLEAIGPYLKDDVVISDTARSKATTLAWARDLLPKHVHFVGGNPVVHPAGAGHENAEADLFQGRLYCLTPAPSAHEEAVQLVVNLVTMLGAEPFFLDAAEHDGLVTATENLPNLLSIALFSTLSQQNSWREIRKLAGGLFERVSTGADGDPDSLASNFLENSDALIHWLDQYVGHLHELRTLLVAGDDQNEELTQKIDKAIVARVNWLRDFEKGDFIDPELTSPKVERPNLLNQMIGFGRFRKSPQKEDK
jgi:prephenate dehydrogenase